MPRGCVPTSCSPRNGRAAGDCAQPTGRWRACSVSAGLQGIRVLVPRCRSLAPQRYPPAFPGSDACRADSGTSSPCWSRMTPAVGRRSRSQTSLARARVNRAASGPVAGMVATDILLFEGRGCCSESATESPRNSRRTPPPLRQGDPTRVRKLPPNVLATLGALAVIGCTAQSEAAPGDPTNGVDLGFALAADPGGVDPQPMGNNQGYNFDRQVVDSWTTRIPKPVRWCPGLPGTGKATTASAPRS